MQISVIWLRTYQNLIDHILWYFNDKRDVFQLVYSLFISEINIQLAMLHY